MIISPLISHAYQCELGVDDLSPKQSVSKPNNDFIFMKASNFECKTSVWNDGNIVVLLISHNTTKESFAISPRFVSVELESLNPATGIVEKAICSCSDN